MTSLATLPLDTLQRIFTSPGFTFDTLQLWISCSSTCKYINLAAKFVMKEYHYKVSMWSLRFVKRYQKTCTPTLKMINETRIDLPDKWWCDRIPLHVDDSRYCGAFAYVCLHIIRMQIWNAVRVTLKRQVQDAIAEIIEADVLDILRRTRAIYELLNRDKDVPDRLRCWQLVDAIEEQDKYCHVDMDHVYFATNVVDLDIRLKIVRAFTAKEQLLYFSGAFTTALWTRIMIRLNCLLYLICETTSPLKRRKSDHCDISSLNETDDYKSDSSYSMSDSESDSSSSRNSNCDDSDSDSFSSDESDSSDFENELAPSVSNCIQAANMMGICIYI